MSIARAFDRGKAFIAFITCGDPCLETTEELICAMEREGVDLIELGIPFSDPTAEGPTIQDANLRALSGGVTTDDILEMVARVRGKVSVPLVFMTYANVVYSYGAERFCEEAAKAGVEGLILPDVPFEEHDEFARVCDAHGIELVSMIAPTSRDRIATIARSAKCFVYCVSSLGVTGARSSIATDIGAMTSLVREVTDVPVAVGFGISTPEQAASIARDADGVIIGSAIVRLVGRDGRQSVPAVSRFVRDVRTALDEATM
jgi:tryptophan synthase alpha chain